MLNNLRGKKVLVMGLGILGGGIATAKWLVKHGARVTVTDLKSRRELEQSIRSLGGAARKIKFVLGEHREDDFKKNEIIVVNPAVPRESKFLKIARQSNAQLENEASIFFRFCRNPIIGVTGTRGKTTTANWIYHFLKLKYRRAALTGNSSSNPMLKALDRLDGKSPVVVELSSWHLELLPQSGKAPHIAVITNLYPDHLNRYRGMKDYARAKANIFKDQTHKDFLILNQKNKWTNFFRRLRTAWHLKNRLVLSYGKFHFPFDREGSEIGKIRQKLSSLGKHNLENLDCAIKTAKLVGVPFDKIKKAIFSLPPIKFREETIYETRSRKIVNDSAATSPDATIAALRRFGGVEHFSFAHIRGISKSNLILIAGGTDKNLIFRQWAKAVEEYVEPENLYLLEGSATKKMLRELRKIGYFKKAQPQLFENLPDILKAIRRNMLNTKYQITNTILFSPGAASFEKFKNEFDRGESFNRYVKKALPV